MENQKTKECEDFNITQHYNDFIEAFNQNAESVEVRLESIEADVDILTEGLSNLCIELDKRLKKMEGKK